MPLRGLSGAVGIKRLLDDLEVTAAKLMLLVYKLLLLVKITTAERLQLLKDKDCLKIKISYEIGIVIYRIDL
ncbi:hypothetical protein Tco_0937957 [Tanacetum coccineum]|uniref:Uncharacterized protein n=1 Tax=Tanacetum coccineum TaxID=301880 RepID=A0ABQ5DGR7_9ASTR